MSLSNNQKLFARDIAKLILYVIDQGYTCTLGEAYRTPEQAAIYAQEGKGIKDSLHCKRLAIDINLFKGDDYLTASKDYAFLGEYWESLDPQNRWGGRFKDGNHFERQE